MGVAPTETPARFSAAILDADSADHGRPCTHSAEERQYTPSPPFARAPTPRTENLGPWHTGRQPPIEVTRAAGEPRFVARASHQGDRRYWVALARRGSGV